MPQRQQIEAVIADAMSANPGLCIAVGCVTSPGQPDQSQIFYFPDVDDTSGRPLSQNGQPITIGDTTQWMLASNTKTFTSSAYARQMPNCGGVLVEEYLSQQTVIFQEMTLDSLVNYQSGLPQDNQSSSVDTDNPPNPYLTADMLTYLATNQLSLANGTGNGINTGSGYGYAYSNLAFSIMGCVLEAQSSSSLQEVYNAQLFNDLGMSCTLFQKSLLANIPQGFNYDQTQNFTRANLGNPLFPAYYLAGGLVATAPDMITWLKFNMGWYIGSDDPNLQAMSKLLAKTQSYSTEVTASNGSSGPYLGLGWFLEQPAYTNSYSPIFFKDGGLSGVRSYILFSASDTPGSEAVGGGVFVLLNARGLTYPNKYYPDMASYLAHYLHSVLCDAMPPAEM